MSLRGKSVFIRDTSFFLICNGNAYRCVSTPFGLMIRAEDLVWDLAYGRYYLNGPFSFLVTYIVNINEMIMKSCKPVHLFLIIF